MPREPRANGTRPPDRAAALVAIAEEQFGRRGYHAVSVHDIAATAGISGPALYRHFASKQDLFATVLTDGLAAMHEVTEVALTTHPSAGRGRLRAVTAGLATLAVQRRAAAALWRWSSGELPDHERAAVAKRGQELVTRWAEVLREDRRDVTADQAQLLCLAALSVFGSVAVHRTSLSKGKFVALLADTAGAVLMATPPGTPDPCAELPVSTEHGRREQILSAATRLFAEHGYRAVSMEDIGRAVGLAAPSVYRHFGGKDQILRAAATRMGDRLMLEAGTVLGATPDPRTALHALLESYVDNLARYSDLATVYSREVTALPEADRTELLTVQRDYVAQWVAVLREAAPERTEAEAKVLVHAALTVVNDLARTPWARARPAHRAESVTLGAAALGILG